MASPKTLAQFRLEAVDDGETARLHIEDEAGDTLELIATREQLDLLAEAIDEMLTETEEADEA